MALDVRNVPRSDATAYIRAVGSAFGNVSDEEEIEHWLAFFDEELALGVYDRDHIVGTAGANRFELTLPAGPGATNPTVTVPGVTAVGVVPTHRRKGLLSKLMTRQLGDFKRAGFPLSILCASESIIYGRFGYGLGQSFQSVTIERRTASFRDAPRVPGRLRLVDRDEAAKTFPALHDLVRLDRPGEISRLPQWWDACFRDRERDRGGATARTFVIHESPAGEADGYATYRQVTMWPDGMAANKILVEDMAARSAPVHGALWRFLLDLDLSAEISAQARPLDEPLRWMLADPRRLRTTRVCDHLWVRILDIPAALAARGYSSDDRLVLEVADPARNASSSFTIDTSAEAGGCRRSRKGEEAELALSLADLGAIYLGGIAPSVLASAGRVRELRRGALARADRAFASPSAPFCSIDF